MFGWVWECVSRMVAETQQCLAVSNWISVIVLGRMRPLFRCVETIVTETAIGCTCKSVPYFFSRFFSVFYVFEFCRPLCVCVWKPWFGSQVQVIASVMQKARAASARSPRAAESLRLFFLFSLIKKCTFGLCPSYDPRLKRSNHSTRIFVIIKCASFKLTFTKHHFKLMINTCRRSQAPTRWILFYKKHETESG